MREMSTLTPIADAVCGGPCGRALRGRSSDRGVLRPGTLAHQECCGRPFPKSCPSAASEPRLVEPMAAALIKPCAKASSRCGFVLMPRPLPRPEFRPARWICCGRGCRTPLPSGTQARPQRSKATIPHPRASTFRLVHLVHASGIAHPSCGSAPEPH